MRLSIIIAAAGFITGAISTQAAEPPVRKIHKTAIVALARDAARAAEVELAVKHILSEHGVATESVRTLALEKPDNAQALVTLIRSQGYDSLLCMGPRKTIRLTPADKEGALATVETCLNGFLTGNSPSGEPLEVSPVVADAQTLPTSGGATSLKTPIPTNPAAAPLTVYKGQLRFFDITTEKLIWEGHVNSKMPSDMRAGIQIKVLTHDIGQAIRKSGLLP